MPREARRDFLSSYYFFDCNCMACEKDYPMLPELKKCGKLPWRCLDCHGYFENGICSDCKNKMNVEKMIDRLDNIKQQIDENKIKAVNSKEDLAEIYDKFCDNMAQLTTILGPNCELVVENEHFFRSLLCKLFGNKTNIL